MTSSQFEQSFAAIRPDLSRVARSLCRSRDAAEDLVQTTAIKAFQGLHGFDHDCSFKNWCLRILKNAFLDEQRLTKMSECSLDALLEEGPICIDDNDIHDQAATIQLLEQAAAEYGGEEPEVVLAAILTGDYAGIARSIAVSPRRLRLRAHRMRAFLRAEMATVFKN